MPFRADNLDVDRAMVLVIDIQEKLLPTIDGHELILGASCKLLEAAGIFELPVLATEQYAKGIGPTHGDLLRLLRAAGAQIIDKPTFSACGYDPVRSALAQIDRPQVIVSGIEAHVCVQQTALDLAAMDYDVYVCADAVGSRSRTDYEFALQRVRTAGVLVTTVESVMFELCERCDTDRFKRMLEVIKLSPPQG